MRRIPTIKSVMTPFPYSVEADAPVEEAREFMWKHKIRHLPVTDNGELAGMLSDRDINLMLGPDFAYPDANDLKVRDAMTATGYTVDMNARLDTVLDYMVENHVDSVAVTRKGKLAGVFTVTDACRAFAEFLREQARRSGGNEVA